jgi:hypothetical protein
MTTTTETWTVTVRADRLPEARHALDKLVRKAARYGCPDIRYTVGSTRKQQREIPGYFGGTHKFMADVVDLVIEGTAPRYGNHEFLARVEIGGEAGNLLAVRPGVEDLDPRFRVSRGHCEHCRTDRQRREVFVCRELETGAQVQVGRTCLRDYLGIDNPAHIAARFNAYADIRDVGEEYGGRRDGWGHSMVDVLTAAAVAIRLFGWASKGAASADDSITATVSYVQLMLLPRASASKIELPLYDRLHDAVSDEDRALAQETLTWAREELRGTSDYEHNLRVVLAQERLTDWRRMGVAVSGVAALQRAKERALRLTKERGEAATSEWLGAEGERLRGLKVTQVSSRVVGGGAWGECILVKFRDEAGNLLSWFTGVGTEAASGEQLVIDGTVKKHNEYQGVKETVLTRVKVKGE